MKNRIALFCFFVIIYCAYGCNNNSSIWHKSARINESEWNKDDIVSLDFNNKDTISKNDIFIVTLFDPFQCKENIDLIVKSESPVKKYFCDTITIRLGNSDNPAGAKVSQLYDQINLYRSKAIFNQIGNYKFNISPLEDTKGIRGIGMEIRLAK